MNAECSPLAAALARNRLQQKHVAEALGVSRMAVLAWFHSRSIPTGANLVKLVDFLRKYEPTITAEALLPPATTDAALKNPICFLDGDAA